MHTISRIPLDFSESKNCWNVLDNVRVSGVMGADSQGFYVRARATWTHNRNVQAWLPVSARIMCSLSSGGYIRAARMPPWAALSKEGARKAASSSLLMFSCRLPASRKMSNINDGSRRRGKCDSGVQRVLREAFAEANADRVMIWNWNYLPIFSRANSQLISLSSTALT